MYAREQARLGRESPDMLILAHLLLLLTGLPHPACCLDMLKVNSCQLFLKWALSAPLLWMRAKSVALLAARDLCEKIVSHLSWSIGKARFRTFANGEISVKLEQSVSNYDVFVVRRPKGLLKAA